MNRGRGHNRNNNRGGGNRSSYHHQNHQQQQPVAPQSGMAPPVDPVMLQMLLTQNPAAAAALGQAGQYSLGVPQFPQMGSQAQLNNWMPPGGVAPPAHQPQQDYGNQQQFPYQPQIDPQQYAIWYASMQQQQQQQQTQPYMQAPPPIGRPPLPQQQQMPYNQDGAGRGGNQGQMHSGNSAVSMPLNDDGDEIPSRTLFIRNIEYTITCERVRQDFSQFGDIKECYFLQNKKGLAFCTFFDIRAAAKAKETMQNYKYNGRPVDVHYSAPKEEDLNAKKCEKDKNQASLLVSLDLNDKSLGDADPSKLVNLSRQFIIFPYLATIDNEQLKQFLEQYGEVKRVRYFKEFQRKRFVEFYDIRGCEAAYDNAQGAPFQNGTLRFELAWDVPQKMRLEFVRATQVKRAQRDYLHKQGKGIPAHPPNMMPMPNSYSSGPQNKRKMDHGSDDSRGGNKRNYRQQGYQQSHGTAPTGYSSVPVPPVPVAVPPPMNHGLVPSYSVSGWDNSGIPQDKPAPPVLPVVQQPIVSPITAPPPPFGNQQNETKPSLPKQAAQPAFDPQKLMSLISKGSLPTPASSVTKESEAKKENSNGETKSEEVNKSTEKSSEQDNNQLSQILGLISSAAASSSSVKNRTTDTKPKSPERPKDPRLAQVASSSVPALELLTTKETKEPSSDGEVYD
ncbi:hypothetical protein MP638_002230 [Amoeboaphelidium occidentale]|nr:hypothetical protein MP638_002230 [Amoeboaphelidium occidentale]